MDARPRGIALALLVVFALALTGAALFFLGCAGLVVTSLVFSRDDSREVEGSLVVVGTAIFVLLGSAFAWVAAAIWRVVIGPRR